MCKQQQVINHRTLKEVSIAISDLTDRNDKDATAPAPPPGDEAIGQGEGKEEGKGGKGGKEGKEGKDGGGSDDAAMSVPAAGPAPRPFRLEVAWIRASRNAVNRIDRQCPSCGHGQMLFRVFHGEGEGQEGEGDAMFLQCGKCKHSHWLGDARVVKRLDQEAEHRRHQGRGRGPDDFVL